MARNGQEVLRTAEPVEPTPVETVTEHEILFVCAIYIIYEL